MKRKLLLRGGMVILSTFLALLFVAYGCDNAGDQPATGGSACTDQLKPGDDLKCREGNRTYYLYAPQNFDPGKPATLVVDAHGAMETATEHAGLDTEFCANGMCWPGKGSGWRLEADMPGAGFIVLTPQGTNNVWRPADEAFILDAVAHAKTIANIDKVFISGISNGGALTYWVGCPNTDIFSGMAPVAGGANCTDIDNPIPVITFDAEPDFAYQGSSNASDKMVELNNCKSGPEVYLTVDSNYNEPICRDDPYGTNPTLVPCSSIIPAIKPTVCKRWSDCDGGVDVVFCDVAPANNHGAVNAASDAHILYGNASHLNLPSLAWRFFNDQMDDGGDTGGDDGPVVPGCGGSTTPGCR